MDVRELDDLLLEAAPTLGARRLTRLDERSWRLIDEAGDELEIVMDVALPRLVLTAEIGPLPARDRLRACELLLTCNLAWPAHGGLRAALDPDHDAAVLLLDVPLQGLTSRGLSAVLRNLLAAARAWAEALGDRAVGEAFLDPLQDLIRI